MVHSPVRKVAPSLAQCVILAGGRGSRLGQLTRDLPKPLISVAGKPFIDHLITRCERFGFSEVLVLAGYKAEALEAWERRRRPEPPQITVLREDGPRGTAGAIVAAAAAKGVDIEALSLAELQAIEPRIKPNIIGQLSVASAVGARTSFGGTAPDEVRARIADAKQRFGLA